MADLFGLLGNVTGSKLFKDLDDLGLGSANDDSAISNRSIGGVRIQGEFARHEDIIRYQMSDELFGSGGEVAVHGLFKEDNPDSVIDSVNGVSTPAMLNRKNRDTTLGGNDAINCDWQFNENDDLIHEMTSIAGGGLALDMGMGRVYSEVFDDKQQIMYLTFGVPEFSSLTGFFDNVIDSDTAKLANTGDYSSFAGKIATLVGKTAGYILILPILPLKFLDNLFAGAFGSRACKYFDFKATMPSYYKTVITMLSHIAVNLGLSEMLDKGETDGGEELPGLADIFKIHGVDICSIMSRRDVYDKVLSKHLNLEEEIALLHTERNDNETEKNIDDYDSSSALHKFISGFKNGATGSILESTHFVGFKIGKSVDSSESASNSTGEIPIMSMVNEKARAGRDMNNSMMGGNIGEGLVATTLSAAFMGAKAIVEGFADALSVGTFAEVLKGSGYVDIPEVWQSSSFSKSYSFTMQLRAPAADIVSQFYYLYVPLAMILCGAFPRATGKASYTSPFMVRAFCKGMFAIPMGIIDNITIKRGDAEFGWSINNLPTCIDISFTIKDLSPIMYVAAADTMAFTDILGQNGSYQEYLLTLSGATIKQRLLWFQRSKDNTKKFLKIFKNTKLNGALWGMSLVNNTVLGRAINKFSPTSKIPDHKLQ